MPGKLPMKSMFPEKLRGNGAPALLLHPTWGPRAPDLRDTTVHEAHEATFAYEGALCRKPRTDVLKAPRQELPQKGKSKTITHPWKSKFIEEWQVANPTTPGLLGLLTVGKYKQITSSATNSQQGS